MLLNLIKRRYTKDVVENPLKVQAKVRELNKGKLTPQWAAVPGFFAFTGFEFPKYGQGVIFNPSFGFPVKVFINNVSGEMRAFSAYFFKD